MLLENNNYTLSDSDVQHIENDKYKVYWKGFVYILSVESGQKTVEQLINLLGTEDLKEVIDKLHGNFFMSIYDKNSDTSFSFIDNSGLFEAYSSEKIVSTSFLKLVKEIGLGKEDINQHRIIEFLNAGVLYQKRTFFKEIIKINRTSIIKIHNNEMAILEKKHNVLEGEKAATDSFVSFFEGLATSLKNAKVSVDLTGGIDSRLLATILDYFKVNYDCSVSGTPNDKDVKIARQVANNLGRSLKISERTGQIDEGEIKDLFYFCDGLYEIFNAYSGRNSQIERKERNIDLIITGAGGELYKDFFWLQDFPNYRSPNSNVSKLYHSRILPLKFDNNLLTDELSEINRTFSQNAIKELEEYKQDINTKTYDQIYYFYRMQTLAGRLLTSSSSIIDSYSPLLEFDVVKVGYNLPRKKRFFNNFHREIITKMNPEVAKIKTTEGNLSVSSNKYELIKDSSKYATDKGKRVVKKLGQKVLKKKIFAVNYHHQDFYETVRRMPIVNDMVKVLQREGILSKTITIQDIKNDYLGRIISLGLLYSYLER